MNDTIIERESQVREMSSLETAVCLLTHTKKVEVQQRLHLYADYLCHLLNGRIRQIELLRPNSADGYFYDQNSLMKPCDLTVFGEPDRSLVKRLLVRYDKPRLGNNLNTSLLIAREPRQPIKKILLLMRAEESDAAAVAWVCRLAANRDMQVTCLPVIPAQPGLYRYGKPLQPHQTMVLAEGTSSAENLNRFVRQLDRERVNYVMCLQAGEPQSQIKQALDAAEYDLVIIAAEPYGRMQRFLLGELVTPLLHWLDRPILIAKPPGVT